MPRLILQVLTASLCLVIVLSGIFIFAPTISAQTADQLQQNIVDSTSQISSLQAEIATLQKQLTTTSQQKQTLQTAVTALDLNIKKITTTITLTNAQIAQKNAQIKQLSGGIATTTTKIGSTKDAVGNTLSLLDVQDQEPLALLLIAGESISDFFNEAIALDSVRTDLQSNITELSSLKDNLQTSKNTAQQQLKDLATLQSNLAQQKQSLAIARQSQNDLLTQTKNQESNYQAEITQKKAQEAKFESDLLNYESKLTLAFSPSTLPTSGSSPLQWPLSNVLITQYFGDTPFATANPSIYNGHGHDGVDIAASPGTPVMAARAGVVLGTGNTDVTCPGASFGKWIFIQHDDGLSTMYAHLAAFAVSKGDKVTTGQVIGYSDTTGYATGPHLHFGVYASGGSEIASFASKGCPGKTYTMPVADLSAYLNPLSYLPPVP